MKDQKEKKRKYRKYDESFKSEAILQMKNGRSIKELSASLGVGEALLYRWRAQSEGRRQENTEETKALKKELKRLREDNAILKKALSIFSQAE